jgi:organic hydroperoxide reductase OsmC/OhrA
VAHGKVQYTARTHTIGGAYFLQARLNVSLPGLERGVAQALVDAAHEMCPYSKATRGNVDVAIKRVCARPLTDPACP